VLRISAGEPPPYDSELSFEGRAVGRVTSAVTDPEGGVLALAFVRVEVPEDAELDVGGAAARAV
jgi:hypothetical protein